MPDMDNPPGRPDIDPNLSAAAEVGGEAESSSFHGRAHARLRAETRVLHSALDSNLNPTAVLEREGYILYLRVNWPCAAIESALEDAGVKRLLPDWDQRRRRFALARDLEGLGASADLRRFEELKVLDGLRLAPGGRRIDAETGAILGWTYVLEGSRLGAGLILKTVESTKDPGILIATRFLRHGRGENFWGSFKAALSQIDNDEAAIANACAGACAAFKYFAMY
jgi:heme oxygenase